MEFTSDQIKKHISILERTLGFLRKLDVRGDQDTLDMAHCISWCKASIQDAYSDLTKVEAAEKDAK